MEWNQVTQRNHWVSQPPWGPYHYWEMYQTPSTFPKYKQETFSRNTMVNSLNKHFNHFISSTEEIILKSTKKQMEQNANRKIYNSKEITMFFFFLIFLPIFNHIWKIRFSTDRTTVYKSWETTLTPLGVFHWHLKV